MKLKISYWTEPIGMFLGYLNEYPDHWTESETFEDLIQHLADLRHEFETGELPGIKKVAGIEPG